MLDGPRWGPLSGNPARQLVVLLHGVGANGRDLIDLAPHWGPALPDAAFISYDAPQPYDDAPPAMGARQWFSLADRSPEAMQQGAAYAAPLLFEAVGAELARLGIETVAFAGFSQGAMMALYAGQRRAPPPRAVVAFSGALLSAPPDGPLPPVLLVHGLDDNVVPVDRSRQAEARLRAAGVAVTALYRPGLTHAIDEAGLAAAAAFMADAFAAPVTAA